jgi:hypothetical protein
MRARYYDPSTGSFMSVDPLLTLTRSPYGYVYGDPANATDPSGAGTLWDPSSYSRDAFGNVAGNYIWGITQSVGGAVGRGSTDIAGGFVDGMTFGFGPSFGNPCSAAFLVGGFATFAVPGPGAEAGAAKAIRILAGLERGRSPGVKVVGSEDELRALYAELSKGGTPVPFTGKAGGEAVILSDGTRVQIRNGSDTGGATIDVFREGAKKEMKVHIK